jgi:hypothetical protein
MYAWPSAEKSPVSDSDAPMVIGAVELGLGLVLLLLLVVLLLLLLLHAAIVPTERTATAVRANVFLENQGRSGLTPGPSFLLVQARPVVRFRMGSGLCLWSASAFGQGLLTVGFALLGLAMVRYH